MFDMGKCGRTISEARKKKNMTQMELADRMGISFQAVSNWERGVSMPDISKLLELSEVLGVTVDEILGKPSSLIETFAADQEKVAEELPKITLEEFKEAAPLLKPTQVDEVADSFDFDFDLDEIEDLLPFLGRQTCEKIFVKASAEGDMDAMEILAPFVSREVIDKELIHLAKRDEDVEDLMPFASREACAQIGWELYQNDGIEAIEDLAPCMPKELLEKIAQAAVIEDGGEAIEALAPFLSREMLEKLAEMAVREEGIEAIEGLAPFLSKETMRRLAKESVEKYGIGSIKDFAPFLGKEFLIELIQNKYK